MLIAMQRPGASQVAGFHKWLELHRYVRKGEKGISILAPMIIKGKREESRADDSSEPGPRLIGFKTVYVFDASQTDGEPLAEWTPDITGEVGTLTARLTDHIQAAGTPVTRDAGIAPALGRCSPTDIKILPDLAPAQEFAVLVHEYAHALLHRGTRRQQTTKTIRETEAEAVSFIVATAAGFECGQAASDYIQMYNGNTETLIESLQAIQSAAAEILTALES
jgi:antirestriction protein ArdC